LKLDLISIPKKYGVNLNMYEHFKENS
jgi:hypothetical protein